MENQHSLSLDLTTKSFSVSGSKEFVVEYYEKITILLNTSPQLANQLTKVSKEVRNASSDHSSSEGSLYSYDSEKVHFHIKKAPGSSKAEKTQNLALLYAYFMKDHGHDVVDTNSIREVAEDFGCLDSKNFATHIKAIKDKVLISGPGNNKNIKLIKPGIIYVEELIKNLSNDGE